MQKRKWANFCGSVLAGTTLVCTAAAARSMQHKFGTKNEAFRADLSHFAGYAFERLVLANPKVVDKLAPYFGDETEDKILEEVQ